MSETNQQQPAASPSQPQPWITPQSAQDEPLCLYIDAVLRGEHKPETPQEEREFARLFALKAEHDKAQARLAMAQQQAEAIGREARAAETDLMRLHGSISERVSSIKEEFESSRLLLQQAGAAEPQAAAPKPKAATKGKKAKVA